MFYLRTLGELSLYGSDRSDDPILANTKPLVLLALLATNPKYSARRDHVAELLWPGSDHSRARRSLRQALFYLSKQVGAALIQSDDTSTTLTLDAQRVQVDLWEFDRALRDEDYEQALGIYGGPFLRGSEDKAGLEVEHWIEAQNARIQVGLEVAYTQLISQLLERGATDRAVEAARAYADLNPLNEQAQITLVRTLKAAGDEVGALAAYQSYRTLLERELEEEPPEALQETMERIRAAVLQTPSLPEPVDREGLSQAAPTAEAERVERRVEEEAGVTIGDDGDGAGAEAAAEVEAEAEAETDKQEEEERERERQEATPREPAARAAATATGPADTEHPEPAAVTRATAETAIMTPTRGLLPAAIIATGVIAAAGLLILAGRLFLTPGRATPLDPLAEMTAEVEAILGQGSTARVGVVRVRGDDVEVSVTDLPPTELPSPDGARVAFTHRAEDGWNLAVRDIDSREIRHLTTRPGDEYPEAWSPDGRYLLYSEGTLLPDGRSYRHQLMVYDLQTGDQRRLTRMENGTRIAAAWAPDGTRIAFVADLRGKSEVFVADFDGDPLLSVSSHRENDTDPAWSPDGSSLAFVSDRNGAPDLFLVRPDGTDLRQLTSTPARVRTPIWVGPALILFVSATERTADLRAVDVPTGRIRVLTDRGDVMALRRRRGAAAQPAWIDRVEIRPRVDVASPGEHLELDVHITDSAGGSVNPDEYEITWASTDTTVVTVDDGGTVHVREAGPVAIAASLRGWRTDTLRVVSIPLIQRDVAPSFVEDWTEGLRPERWRLFGEPLPTAEPGGGPGEAGVFFNNGDAHFASGAVSDTVFAVDTAGFAVEVYGRMPFTGKLFQTFGLALYPAASEDSLDWAEAGPLLEFSVRGPAGEDPAEAWVVARDRQSRVPFPRDPGSWHLYTLQITPDGTVELVIDGTLHWRSTWQLAPTVLEKVRVGLGYQSLETRILHGPVRVYPQPRYFLLDLTPQTED